MTDTARPDSQRDERDTPYRYTAALAAEIEARWQDRWDAEGTFEAPNPAGPLAEPDKVAARPKRYVLDMFPYPSGIGLHVGHPLGYVATDVHGRFKRMTGHNVLHALGYDAFGLPAEQYAVQTGQHPRVTTEANIATMREQLRRLGLAHDRRRSVSTTDPEFYRWTQWIFLQVYNSWYDERGRPGPSDRRAGAVAGLRRATRAGRTSPASRPVSAWADLDALDRRRVVDAHRLVYLSHSPVNWCPGLGTVLANEEVTAEGRSDRGNFPVFKRDLRQWMMRITAYAPTAADRPGPAGLAGVDQAAAAQLDRPLRGRAGPLPQRGRRHRGLHDPAGHAVRRHVHGRRAGAPDGGPAGLRRLADRRTDRLDRGSGDARATRSSRTAGPPSCAPTWSGRPRAGTRPVSSPARSPPTRSPTR